MKSLLLSKRRGGQLLAACILFLSGAGLFLAFFFGLGWFFLAQSIRESLFAIKALYLFLVRIGGDPTLVEKETLRLSQKEVFVSSSMARRLFISIGITILVFLKLNVVLSQYFLGKYTFISRTGV